MKQEKINNSIDEISKILEKVSQKRDKKGPNFGNDIFLNYGDIENTIKNIDDILTNIAHGGVCSSCVENCEECELASKKESLYRVFKIIKGDWAPNHR